MESKTLDSNLIAEEERYTEKDIANGGRRFANSLIDTIVIYALYFILILITASGGTFGVESVGMQFSIYLLMIGYYTVMEFTIGKTVGKMLTGTKVITIEGEKPDFKTAFVRSLCRFIPFDAFSFLGTPCAGWHDTIAKSRVIYDR